MYWRDAYRSEESAVNALIAEERGVIRLSPAHRQAAAKALSDLCESDRASLGSLKSILKKVKKLSPSHAIAKAVAPKLYKKIEKIEPAGLLKVNKKHAASATTSPAPAAPPSTSVVTPLSLPAPVDMSAFAPLPSGGGGTAAFSQPSADTPPATDTSSGGFSLTDPFVLLAIGGAALILFLMLKKKR